MDPEQSAIEVLVEGWVQAHESACIMSKRNCLRLTVSSDNVHTTILITDDIASYSTTKEEE